jgi:uncharacterized protein YyaL (SSP411 family)
VAIVGEPGQPGTEALVDELFTQRYLPNAVVAIAAPSHEGAGEAVPLLRDRPQLDGRPTAYVCRRFVCRLPVTEPAALAQQLDEAARAG